MDKQSAERLITNTFDYPFDIGKYKLLSRNIFKEFEEAEFSRHGTYIPEAFRSHIKKYERLGKYEDAQGKGMDILIVFIKEGLGLDRARTLQRNFISNYLDDTGKGAALVAFTTSDMEVWRFSLITIDYKTVQDESGKIKTERDLSSAKRFSFLVGKNEANHTAQQQVIPLLTNNNAPSIEDLEHAFSVEQVTEKFYQDYKKRFLELGYEINRVLDKDEKIKKEFAQQNISTDNFAKKLMGQIVFLYFVQKKGWLGVGKDNNGNFLKWGEGDKKFMRSLFEKKFCEYDNYFNDVLEPLFYEALATERANNYYSNFECKIPFLSGGLFEAMNGYNWQETDITISNNVIELILDTFDRYNFTVKEDDPLDKEVAIDPEMLGKVFENLLPENLKKGNGAFYTPRPIVHYMCQESLINYLDTHLIDVEKTDITLLVKEGEAVIEHDKIAKTKKEGYKGKYEIRMPSSIIENATEIDKLLTYVKICDPAIGSGAFPMGLLHEIVEARNVLTTYIGNEQSRTKYHLKEDCIQNSIYGVDIDEGAIEISKLRLWLSLIVDENDIENIKPLPNLDYKIICGNSLISRYELDSPIDVVFSEFNKKVKSKDYNNKEIRDLLGNQEVDLKFYKKLTNDFLTESSHNKKIIFRELIGEIKNAFKTELEDKDIQKLSDTRGALANLSRINIFGEQEGTKTEINKVKKKLEKLEKQKQETQDGAVFKNAIEWRFEFPNLLDDNGSFVGFDILIANPPYIKEYANKGAFDGFRKSSYYQGKMDLWYGFGCIGLDLIKENGFECFIAQNNWTTSAGASKFREKILTETKIILFTDFYNFKVFKTAGIQTMIYLLRKEVPSNNYNIRYSFLKNDLISYNELVNFLDFDSSKLIYDKFCLDFNNSDYQNSFITFNNPKIENVLNSIISERIVYLLNNEVAQGIVFPQNKLNKKSAKKLGDNYKLNDGVFQINNNELNELCLDKNELSLIKPFYTSTELSRFYGNENNKEWVIYTESDIKNTINLYPNIKTHLDNFSEIITSDNQPYGLHRSRNERFFQGEKIFSLRKNIIPQFTYTNFDCYVSQTFYSIKTDRFNLQYLTVILNSKLIAFWLRYKGKMQGSNYQIDKEPLLNIPLKMPNTIIQNTFMLLANKIIADKKNEDDTIALERQVDVMVCKLYELTYAEVLIVDEEFAMSEVEYNNFEL